MTADKTINLINSAYGYSIIDHDEEGVLKTDMDSIISELGIGTIYEFLSYDVTEFAEIRKTIHARRFYQLFKNTFSYSSFDMKTFHEIQAGCILITSLFGSAREAEDYEYSGFVKEILSKISRINPVGSKTTLNEKFFYLQSIFEKFSRVSLGIYSLQIFTKYSMIVQEINKTHERTAGKLMMSIIDEMNTGEKAEKNINKLLSLKIISPEKLEEIINDYISYAVTDISVQGIAQGSKKADKANRKLTEDISDEIHDAFSGLKMDVADLYSLRQSILSKKPIYEKEYEQPGVSVFFAALLERYTSLFERLWYYESNSFIKKLNMIFINRVKEMFEDQRKQELGITRNGCIRIIEERLPMFRVYELERVLSGFGEDPDMFAKMNNLGRSDVKKAIKDLTAYLDANIKTGAKIQEEMKNNLQRILGPESIPEGEMKILKKIVYDFEAVMELLAEDNQ